MSAAPGIIDFAMGPHHPIDEALLSRLGSTAVRDEEKQPLEAKVRVASTGSVPEVLEALARVEARDRRAEKLKPVLYGGGIVGAVGAIIALFLEAPLAAWLGAAVAALLSFLGGIITSRYDVSGRKLEAMYTLLSTFASELRRGRPVRLQANLSGLTKMPAQRDGDRTVYTCDWLHVALPLADGTRALVMARGSLKRKKRRKRKYTKLKDVLAEQLTVQFIPPKGTNYAANASPPRPDVSGFYLTRAEIRPRRALFMFRSRTPRLRRFGRKGWHYGMPGHLLDGNTIVAALIQSYRATATANRALS